MYFETFDIIYDKCIRMKKQDIYTNIYTYKYVLCMEIAVRKCLRVKSVLLSLACWLHIFLFLSP